MWLEVPLLQVCIDQSNIGDGLKVLPINVMECSKLLMVCGSTYSQRLWCVWLWVGEGAGEEGGVGERRRSEVAGGVALKEVERETSGGGGAEGAGREGAGAEMSTMPHIGLPSHAHCAPIGASGSSSPS